jgi:hypothetical protein
MDNLRQVKTFGVQSPQECFCCGAEIKLAYIVKEMAELPESLPLAGYACREFPNECVTARR